LLALFNQCIIGAAGLTPEIVKMTNFNIGVSEKYQYFWETESIFLSFAKILIIRVIK
jgi:hypothetical protein